MPHKLEVRDCLSSSHLPIHHRNRLHAHAIEISCIYTETIENECEASQQKEFTQETLNCSMISAQTNELCTTHPVTSTSELCTTHPVTSAHFAAPRRTELESDTQHWKP